MKTYLIPFGKGLEHIESYVDEKANEKFINTNYRFPRDFVRVPISDMIKY